jgi:hypothetical protein
MEKIMHSIMKMTLTVKERLQLPSILPSKGSFLEMRTRKRILDMVDLTDEESKEVNLRPTETGLAWGPTEANPDAKSNLDREFEFSYEDAKYLREMSEKVDNENLVDNTNYEIIEKIYDTIIANE